MKFNTTYFQIVISKLLVHKSRWGSFISLNGDKTLSAQHRIDDRERSISPCCDFIACLKLTMPNGSSYKPVTLKKFWFNDDRWPDHQPGDCPKLKAS